MAKIIITDDDIANEPSQSNFSPESQSLPPQYSPLPNNNTLSNSTKTNPFVIFTIVLLLLLVLVLGGIVVAFCLGALKCNSSITTPSSTTPSATTPSTITPQAVQPPNKNDIYKENIKKVILLNQQYFEPVDAFAPPSDEFSNETLDQFAQLIFNYVQNAKRSINYDTLPSEFTTAYSSYLNAWNQLAQEIANHPNMDTLSNFIGSFFSGFVHGFTGDINGIMDDLDKASDEEEWPSRLQQGWNNIQSTWIDVETAAGKYGINVNNVE